MPAAGETDVSARDATPKQAATRALLAFADAFAPGAAAAGGPPGFDTADVSSPGARKSGLHLRGAPLAGASLRHANLAGADMSQADLSGASCSGIVLDGARLEQAVFRDADLAGASLRRTDAGQACFAGALLEDVCLAGARLRFADFSGAVLDGADASDADLWGAQLSGVVAHRACLRGVLLDEVKLAGADLAGADLTGARLRRADLSGANLREAVLRDTVFDGATLTGVDFSGAVLPHVVLTGCDMSHARFAGAWLERTRFRARQLGGAIGEEIACDYAGAVEGYIVLEQNFRTLGNAQDASWAFRRRRRMGKFLHRSRAAAALQERRPTVVLGAALHWLSDVAAEWLCDYGESLTRILRALALVWLGCAAIYWLTGSLAPRAAGHAPMNSVDYLLFSLDSMTSVGTGEVALRPAGQLGVLISSLQTVAGTVLLGLFGFVLGVRVRN